jgi:hypothetical protein
MICHHKELEEKKMKEGTLTLDVGEEYNGGIDIKVDESIKSIEVKAAIARALNDIKGIKVIQIF